MWSDDNVRELFAVKVVHTSLLNITVVAFKVLPLGSYAPMPASSPSFKTIFQLVLWKCICVFHMVLTISKSLFLQAALTDRAF
jgi:hypothetical protein